MVATHPERWELVLRVVVEVLVALELQRTLTAETLGERSRDESVPSCSACGLVIAEADYWRPGTL